MATPAREDRSTTEFEDTFSLQVVFVIVRGCRCLTASATQELNHEFILDTVLTHATVLNDTFRYKSCFPLWGVG